MADANLSRVLAWTHGICKGCHPEAIRLGLTAWVALPQHRRREQCAACGQPTTDGIYMRCNPQKVPYPRRYDASPRLLDGVKR